MNQEECALLLQQHDIKPTVNRILVARTLATAGQPLTLAELERRILTVDKSGVFRALVLFREHHLVHILDDVGDGVRYELCHSSHDDVDDDLHVHFFCENCHRTYCLGDIPVPTVPLPEGFCPTSTSFIVKGICCHCKE